MNSTAYHNESGSSLEAGKNGVPKPHRTYFYSYFHSRFFVVAIFCPENLDSAESEIGNDVVFVP